MGSSVSSAARTGDADLRARLGAALPWIGTDLAEELARLFVRRDVVKGKVLVRQGSPSEQVILVDRGALRLYFTRPDGREFNKNFFVESGLVLPITGSMARHPSLFGVAALESSVLWVAAHPQFKEMLQRKGAWHTVQRKLLAAMVDRKLQREHDLLSLDARERYEQFCTQYPQLALRIPIGELATYLGITSVSLSRIRHTPRRPRSAP